MLPLTKQELKSHQDAAEYYICRKKIMKKHAKDKNHRTVRYHCLYTGKYRGTSHSICNSKLKIPSEIPVVFNNGSNYDYYFIIKELAK